MTTPQSPPTPGLWQPLKLNHVPASPPLEGPPTSTPSVAAQNGQAGDGKPPNNLNGGPNAGLNAPPTVPAPRSPSLTAAGKFDIALAQNRVWAYRAAEENPTYFAKLAEKQTPEILWIGCSDSRIPETTVLGLQPGDVFVHRNIANILHPGDLNSGAVIEYAVNALGVKHVIVCGHTKCGGVGAALQNKKIGIIDTWLLPLRGLRMKLKKELDGLSESEQSLRLVRENVLQGVRTIKENPDVINAIKERGLKVHGLVYHVGNGNLEEINTEESEEVIKQRLECFVTE